MLVNKMKVGLFVLCLGFISFAEEISQNLPISDSVMISSLNVKDTEIRDLLQGLAVQYDLNLFLDPEVKGPVTVNFNKQKLKDALQLLLSRHGYIYSVDHGVISVRKPLPKAPPPPPKPRELRFVVNWDKNLLSIDVEKAPLEKLVRSILQSCADSIKEQHQGICPEGWHLITNPEMWVVINSTDENIEGVKAGAYWAIGGGMNTSGFTLLGAGLRYRDGTYLSLYKVANWYFPTEYEKNVLRAGSAFISGYDDVFSIDNTYNSKVDAFSVRCVKNY